MKFKKWLGLIVLFLFTLCAESKSVHVAVAANFSNTMKSLVKEFEKTSDYQIALSFGSSGKFYAQIKQGAPYELFFSADQAKPDALEKDGLVIANSRFTYAIGRLALWSARPDFVNKIETKLKQGAFNKLALANPKLAPYGAAALEVLTSLALIDTTQSNWVMGENIAQTYQFVSSGNADLGFIALSQLLGKNTLQQGSYWLVPNIMHHPIKQDVVLLRSAKKNQGAKAFLDFMQTNRAQHIIAEYGYLASNSLNVEHEL
ncbi:molybdate ABC transporter substrate-binding protein [Paraglaciecola sp. MB-3u-78]|uniref:molybdate ABC transporter substrate-binding protein n=1 Tax=Paraglaciecola sp. MB-3u-78 TaxID=2058332 RepID=UPI000C34971D|nr:molybdate ABC transporter substrate-binding protein [Paraglaciecola sp. MB-3u-78]PKG99287.1 molybdate ABC transporter substrate-binding protein [Paraglaciecola sp. MB-3u-78]